MSLARRGRVSIWLRRSLHSGPVCYERTWTEGQRPMTGEVVALAILVEPGAARASTTQRTRTSTHSAEVGGPLRDQARGRR